MDLLRIIMLMIMPFTFAVIIGQGNSFIIEHNCKLRKKYSDRKLIVDLIVNIIASAFGLIIFAIMCFIATGNNMFISDYKFYSGEFVSALVLSIVYPIVLLFTILFSGKYIGKRHLVIYFAYLIFFGGIFCNSLQNEYVEEHNRKALAYTSESKAYPIMWNQIEKDEFGDYIIFYNYNRDSIRPISCEADKVIFYPSKKGYVEKVEYKLIVGEEKNEDEYYIFHIPITDIIKLLLE